MAQQLRDQASRIAAYVNIPRLSASISGSSSLDPYQRGTFRASVRDCGSSATYRWEQADDGRNYRFGGSSSSVTIRAPNAFTVTLRLRITCGGQTVTTFRTVYIGGGGGGGCGNDIICLTGGDGLPGVTAPDAVHDDAQLSEREGAPSSEAVTPPGGFAFTIYPNPLSGRRIGLTFTGQSPIPRDVTFRDLVTGQVVHVAQLTDVVAGAVELELPGLAPGSYAVTCSSGGHRETQLLTIAR